MARRPMLGSSQVIDLALNTFSPKPYGTLPVTAQIISNILNYRPKSKSIGKRLFFAIFPHFFSQSALVSKNETVDS